MSAKECREHSRENEDNVRIGTLLATLGRLSGLPAVAGSGPLEELLPTAS